MKQEVGAEPRDYSIRAVERVCDILDLLQCSADRVSLPDVAKATGLPKSSAFRYLTTLEARRYVDREPDSGDYRLGLAFLPLQGRQHDLLARRARPHLEHLSAQFEETVNVGLLDGTRVLYVDILESPKAVRLAARPGDRELVHCTALGKAIAAWLPAERLQSILDAEGMPARTERTVTDPEALAAQLVEVREKGYAVDDRENELDGRCVAVPLGPWVPAALSLSAPVSRLPLQRLEEACAALTEAATKLAGDIGLSRDGGAAADGSSG